MVFESLHNDFAFIKAITVRRTRAVFHVIFRFSLGFFDICCIIGRADVIKNVEILTAIRVDDIQMILDIYVSDSARGRQLEIAMACEFNAQRIRSNFWLQYNIHVGWPQLITIHIEKTLWSHNRSIVWQQEKKKGKWLRVFVPTSNTNEPFLPYDFSANCVRGIRMVCNKMILGYTRQIHKKCFFWGKRRRSKHNNRLINVIFIEWMDKSLKWENKKQIQQIEWWSTSCEWTYIGDFTEFSMCLNGYITLPFHGITPYEWIANCILPILHRFCFFQFFRHKMKCFVHKWNLIAIEQ